MVQRSTPPIINDINSAWDSGKIHYTLDDPFRKQESIDSVAVAIRSSGGSVDIFDYPGNGHLFTDASLSLE